MGSYSFLDVSCSIDGPGGLISIVGSGVAEEGISIEPVGDKNTMTVGADGVAMHSLSASVAGTVTIKLMKTSLANAPLMTMYNYQTASSARHGLNTIVVRDSARGDLVVINGAAFKKQPSLVYSKEGGMLEWTFDAEEILPSLGGNTLLDLLLS